MQRRFGSLLVLRLMWLLVMLRKACTCCCNSWPLRPSDCCLLAYRRGGRSAPSLLHASTSSAARGRSPSLLLRPLRRRPLCKSRVIALILFCKLVLVSKAQHSRPGVPGVCAMPLLHMLTLLVKAGFFIVPHLFMLHVLRSLLQLMTTAIYASLLL